MGSHWTDRRGQLLHHRARIRPIRKDGAKQPASAIPPLRQERTLALLAAALLPPARRLGRTLAQPADLPPVVELVLEDVKPLEVVVGREAFPERRLPLEPRVVSPAELGESLRTNLLEPASVVVQVVPPDLASRRPAPGRDRRPTPASPPGSSRGRRTWRPGTRPRRRPGGREARRWSCSRHRAGSRAAPPPGRRRRREWCAERRSSSTRGGRSAG